MIAPFCKLSNDKKWVNILKYSSHKHILLHILKVIQRKSLTDKTCILSESTVRVRVLSRSEDIYQNGYIRNY